jgi:hypothetical protein
MKKTLVAGILGLATAVSVMAQSRIALDTYLSSPIGGPYPLITYGAGSSGSLGAAVTSGFTVGVYYSAVAAAFEPATTQGGANVGVPGVEWTLGVGAGSTTALGNPAAGYFSSAAEFVIPGTVNTAYLVVVAYNGANYESSSVRGHSAVFTVAPNTTAFGPGTGLGSAMSGFSVASAAVVPEPSTFALAGLGLASLVIFRRRK